jgi:hypothetical protein
VVRRQGGVVLQRLFLQGEIGIQVPGTRDFLAREQQRRNRNGG